MCVITVGRGLDWVGFGLSYVMSMVEVGVGGGRLILCLYHVHVCGEEGRWMGGGGG